MTGYQKPGVYVEEALLYNNGTTSSATSLALFAGASNIGPLDTAVLCNTWSDYSINFGGDFSDVIGANDASYTSYLPYAVYSYFQNGGKPCYVQRVVGTNKGDYSSVHIIDTEEAIAFTVTALSTGSVAINNLSVVIKYIDTVNKVFTLEVLKDGISAETFAYLSMDGKTGTRKVDTAINDAYSGSTLIKITDIDTTTSPDSAITSAQHLTGGANPDIPAASDYSQKLQDAVSKIEGPIIVNAVGYLKKSDGSYIAPLNIASSTFNRGDIFIIIDGVRQRNAGESSSTYKTLVTNTGTALGVDQGDSYAASYTPWIIIPDPKKAGSTITVPPGGAVAGVISRIDSTIGVFRAPAGLVATITNAVGVDTKYTDSDLGALNEANINAIRPVAGAGIAIMGARTRKFYNADRYVSVRRTLIYIKESMRRSTQYALFENNDQRLWTQLQMTAERLLRPLWEAGGLRGNNAQEAYYIKCDSTLNTPAVIQSGEVRMEIGVALEYPAEFIVIRVTQFESGGFTAEVQPRG